MRNLNARNVTNMTRVMNSIIAKGYQKEEANRLTIQIFDNYCFGCLGGRTPALGVDAMASMILSKADYERQCQEDMWH